MENSVEKIIYTVPELDEKIRLDKYLSAIEELDLSRSLIQSLIGIHHILVDDKFVSKNYRLNGGETITINISCTGKLQ